jgi:omega-6 fatty acid desaturase (delta-12 desaturase)
MHMATEVETNAAKASPVRSLRDFDGMLAAYRGSHVWSSCWQLASTLALFAVGWMAMYFCLSISYWLTLALALPTALLLIRLFILQHDCGHRSFFESKRANDLVGSLLGVLTCTPYACWRREHAMHHACSGDLDRRGKAGEILTMTVGEYRRANWLQRLYYRVYRHPFVLFGFGAFYQFVIRQRFTNQVPKTWRKERLSVHLTNAGLLLLVLLMCWLVGPLNFLLIQVPVMFLAAGIGVWLFYMQHQYEDAYWERTEEWDYVQAAMAGSSYYRLPKLLQWFTGSIGLHHIHHLDARIPNYRLQSCHDANPELQQVHEFRLWESIGCTHAKLWDESQQKMVGFDAVR